MLLENFTKKQAYLVYWSNGLCSRQKQNIDSTKYEMIVTFSKKTPIQNSFI